MARLKAALTHRVRCLPEASATELLSVFGVERSFPAVRSDLSAAFPEAPRDFASAM